MLWQLNSTPSSSQLIKLYSHQKEVIWLCVQVTGPIFTMDQSLILREYCLKQTLLMLNFLKMKGISLHLTET